MPKQGSKRRRVSRAPASQISLIVAQPYLKAAQWLLIAAAVLLVCLELYGPSIHGPLFFDDYTLPLGHPELLWLGGVRPVLMLSYMLDGIVLGSGAGTFPYHFTNLLIHAASTGLVFAIAFRLLLLAGCAFRNRVLLALVASAIFLVHPLQTESVSYIAGRSESLGSFFALAAWTVFLYRRRHEISWLVSLAVLTLVALAAGTKENMIAIVGILLLTDFFWNHPFSFAGIRANWHLYLPMALGSVAAVAWVISILADSNSAGFALTSFTPLTYLLTQSRVLWSYVGLFLFPVNQSIDRYVATSHTPWQHGAFLAILAWVVTIGLAIRYRQRYPLASFGLFVFLIALAPTSSIVPIADVMVERRMYLPMVGLAFIVLEGLKHIKLTWLTVGVLGCVICVYSVATYRRNETWAQPFALWLDAVQLAPLKGRTYIQLAGAASQEGRCRQVEPYFDRAQAQMDQDQSFLHGRAILAECLGNLNGAMESLQQAVAIKPDSSLFELEGLLYGEMGKLSESKIALDRAVKLSPESRRPDQPYESRAYWYEVTGDYEQAKRDYRTAIRLNPSNYELRTRLAALESGVQSRQQAFPRKTAP